MPSRHGDGCAVVADITFMKGKDREPGRNDKKSYDPGGHHLTDRLAQACRPALSTAAMSRHDTRLHLVLGAGKAEICHHVPVRSMQSAGYFTIACAHSVPPASRI